MLTPISNSLLPDSLTYPDIVYRFADCPANPETERIIRKMNKTVFLKMVLIYAEELTGRITNSVFQSNKIKKNI